MSHFPIQLPFSIVSNTHFQNKNLVQSSYLPSNSFNLSQENSFLNRNTREHNMSSNSIGKNKYPETHIAKLRRQNSLNGSIQLKQNDPYSRNCNNLNFLNSGSNSKNQNSNQMVHNLQNSYYNPVISKRSKKVKQFEDINERRQYINQSAFQGQKLQVVKNHHNDKETFVRSLQKQKADEVLSSLKIRMCQLQKKVESNRILIDQHQKKLNQKSKVNSLQNSQIMNQKHLRSFSTTTNSSKNYRQLTQIMTLIEQTKDYQRKNSQQYRKMIEQFRNTILQFRDQLNQTIKRKDYQVQVNKVKESIQQLKAKDSIQQLKSKTYPKDSEHAINKQSLTQNIVKELLKMQKTQIKEQLESRISEIKLQLNKLQENQISIKADIVKINVRQKITAQQNQYKKTQTKQILSQLQQNIQKIITQKSQIFKVGTKYQGRVLSFFIEQILTNCQIETLQTNKNVNSGQNILKNNQNVINTINQQKNSKKCTKTPMKLSKKIYYIDTEGNLLDSNSCYLLNEKGQTITISSKQLSLLRKHGVLSQ